jgi:hypothetical protein
LRIAFYASLVASLCAGTLCVFCFLQIPVHKQTTEAALASLEKQFIDRASLDGKQSERLKYLVGTIRWNDHIHRVTHANLWPAGVYGFLGLALINGFVAYRLRSSLRTFHEHTAA